MSGKIPEETATFHCLTENNDWEGETWYHYFLDEPGVLDTLKLALKKDDNDNYTDWETLTLTWPEATRLTNRGHDGYMQEHWFGRLTKPDELKQADSKALYKGGIRDFGEELFTYESDDDQNKDEETSHV
jgi:hypothetical protein